MIYGTVRIVDHKATGEFWRGCRERAGWSLRKAARHMGVSAPFLSDIERGRRKWTPKWDNQYRDLFGNYAPPFGETTNKE